MLQADVDDSKRCYLSSVIRRLNLVEQARLGTSRGGVSMYATYQTYTQAFIASRTANLILYF